MSEPGLAKFFIFRILKLLFCKKILRSDVEMVAVWPGAKESEYWEMTRSLAERAFWTFFLSEEERAVFWGLREERALEMVWRMF